jgi:hypothetical protein
VRAALVALSVAVLVGAAVAAVRSPGDAEAPLPGWLRAGLAELTLRPGDGAAFPVRRAFAVAAVERALFLDEPPDGAPLVVPALVSGRIARSPLAVDPSGGVDVPLERDVPTWVVAWHDLDGPALARLGTWPPGTRVDAVFLVDGVTGDCCYVTRLVPQATG